MIIDDELSADALNILESATPTTNLDNNVFIHMMALGDNSKNAYKKHHREYVRAAKRAQATKVDFEQLITYPAELIDIEQLASEFQCKLNEHGCFNSIAQNRRNLTDLFSNEMKVARLLILNQNSYTYEQIDSISTMGSFEGAEALGFLISLSVYFHILDCDLVAAEELLLNYFSFLRKSAESTLDLITTVYYVVSYKNIFLPLIERLIWANHRFSASLDAYFYEIPMKEVALRKIAVTEINKMYYSFKVTKSLNHEYCERCNFNYGFMPNVTINEITDFWLQQTLPERTPKVGYLAAKAFEYDERKFEFGNSYLMMLKNPRNVKGDILAKASIPMFLHAGLSYAERDLYLMLFKMGVESNNSSVNELINDPQYLDPYTGNKPYLDNGKICYPGWPELADDDGKFEPVCLRYANQ